MIIWVINDNSTENALNTKPFLFSVNIFEKYTSDTMKKNYHKQSADKDNITEVKLRIESLKCITLSRERTRHIVAVDHKESETASSALANFNSTFKIRLYKIDFLLSQVGIPKTNEKYLISLTWETSLESFSLWSRYFSHSPRAETGGRRYSIDCRCSSGWKMIPLPLSGRCRQW